jgi:hypothetical protein
MGGMSVYFPKERKRVPVWHCLGSFVREKEACPELISAEVGKSRAVVRCRLAAKESAGDFKVTGDG